MLNDIVVIKAAISNINDTLLFVAIPLMGYLKVVHYVHVRINIYTNYAMQRCLRLFTFPFWGLLVSTENFRFFRSKLFIYLLFSSSSFLLLPFSKYLNLYLCLFFLREKKEYGAIN